MYVAEMPLPAAQDASLWLIANQIVRSQTGQNINPTVPSHMLSKKTQKLEGKAV